MTETSEARERIAAGSLHSPPLWWVLVRHEWRLTIRDYFNAAGRRRKTTATVRSKPIGSKRVVIGLVVVQLLLHGFAAAVTWWFPRQWHDTGVTRMTAVAVFAFVSTFMLSSAMSRVVAAFHERRDLDLLLSAPVSPMLLLTIRTGTVAIATLSTFAFFVYPFIDVGVILGRWWMARLYVLLPLIALVMTGIALSLTDLVVRLVGLRRARVGLQVFSALIGASIYLVTQAARFLPPRVSQDMQQWFASITRVDDAPWLVEFIARVARGDVAAWAALIVVGIGLFVVTVRQACRRFVNVAQTPEADSRVVRASHAIVSARIAAGFGRSLFTTLLIKEWRLILRAPQLLSQVLLQILYLMPLLFVAFSNGNAGRAWGPGALSAGIVAASATLATALAWLAISGEDAPDLLAGSPSRAATIVGPKIVAATLPPVVLVFVASIGVATRSIGNAAIVLVFGILACASAAILAAASPTPGKRSDFQRRHRGRIGSGLIEAFQFIVWAAAAGTAVAGLWIVAIVLTILALVMPALRLPRVFGLIRDDD